MIDLKTLQDFNQPQRLSPFNIRLPKTIREKAQKMAAEASTPENRLTETDIYRTAIILFFENASTISREEG